MNYQLYNFSIRCVRCGGCTYGDINSDFSPICPINLKFKFFTYSLGGLRQIYRGLYEGWIEVDKDLSDLIYSCVTCGACVEMCAEWNFEDPNWVQTEIRKLCVNKNLSPKPKIYRDRKKDKFWFDEIEVKSIKEDKVEVYFHAGCKLYSKEDNWKILTNSIKILKKLNINFGILGNEEICCNGKLYELGYIENFKTSAKRFSKILEDNGIKTIITPCPHCYFTFRKLYNLVGISNFEVYHISYFLKEILKKDKLIANKEIKKVTIHDSCYLSRKSDDKFYYQIIREILQNYFEIIEMKRNKENSLCCGGGPSAVSNNIKEFTSLSRIQEAENTKADAIITTCSWCKENLYKHNKLKAYDLLELFQI